MLRSLPRAAALVTIALCACSPGKKAAAGKDSDPAVASIRDKISADSTNWQLWVQLADELRHKNRLDAADSAASKAFQYAPEPGIEARLTMAKVDAAKDESAAAINLVKDAEKKKREGVAVDEVKLAEVYAILTDTAAVYRWLERAKTANSPNFASIKTNPDFASLYNDAHFQALAK